MKIMTMLYALCLSACAHHPSIDTTKYLEESQLTAKKFTEQLAGTLKQQIQTGGVESAIPVCKQIAPALAKEYSTDQKIVKRVSTQYRNTSLGVPDAWEKSTLARFSQKLVQDKETQLLEFSEVVTEGNQKYFRYAKGIRVQAVCLKCHGQESDISPNVRKLLVEHYPQDLAVGYQTGDLRGAVSIKYRLP